jgi:thermitase
MKRLCVLIVMSTLFTAGVAQIPVGAANSDQETKRVLVRFKKDTKASERDKALKDSKAKKTDEVYGDDVWVVESESGESDAKLAAKLDKHPKVVYAEPDLELGISVGPPNDPQYGAQYAHQRINSVAGWTTYPGVYTGTGGPLVAIIDTGIQANHPDLAGRVDTANSRCFGLLCFLTGYADDNGHGTHVAGITAASTNNATGVAGVAYNTRIMAVKVCNAAGTCNTSDIASGINWARDRGARVINMSLGGGGSSTLQTAVQNAYNAGVAIVAAAGNDGNSTLSYPASYPQVVSVAATESNDQRASYSNFNSQVDVAAPGSNVLSTYTGSSYTELSGTSMASPHVAGLAALLRGQNPASTPAQVYARINACSDDLGATGRDDQYGNGRINLGRALGAC